MPLTGQPIETPLGSVEFLGNMDTLLSTKFRPHSVDDCMEPSGQLRWGAAE